jgi:hypothetical protein
MWFCPDKYNIPIHKVNQQMSELKGELEDEQAKISLAKFLRANLGITTELVSGIKLAHYQEITLKGFFNRNFSMCVWGRGCGKTFIAAVYCFLQCIFEPGTKILIAGPTFRTARFIFNNLENLVDTKGAQLLAQAFGAKSKRNDQYEWKINGGSITAIPLSGEKIRGFRANILVLDEFMLLPEEIIRNVLMPFLVAPQDIAERIKIRELEDELISNGSMKEEDRIKFGNNSKMIALSSASYTFENLYKVYKEWMAKIYSRESGDSKYFISQLGYEALPEEMIDKTIIDEAQSDTSSLSSFQREYCAMFTDGSDSYFSAKKMHECTVPDGEEPSMRIIGDKGSEYILAIDPSFSNSPTSDYFAMSVMEIDNEAKQGTLVHCYAVAGGDLRDHIDYLFYLVKNFNIIMIIIDNAGYQFLDSANESEMFLKDNINLKFFDFDTDKDGEEYDKELKRARRNYNLQDKRICIKQLFSTSFIRKANEQLQADIDHRKIWFASRITADGSIFNKVSVQRVPLKMTKHETILDLIEFQDDFVYQTKKQCSLIEVKSTSKGTQSFDLPQHLRRSTSPSRARKDNYTTLMLGNWAIKRYHDMMNIKNESETTFAPILI